MHIFFVNFVNYLRVGAMVCQGGLLTFFFEKKISRKLQKNLGKTRNSLDKFTKKPLKIVVDFIL